MIAVLAWVIIFKTKFGLRLRSVGENPQAADTLGINVYAMRYSGVLISGLLGGMGGAVFAQSISGNFSAGTIVGQGFISMAAMIFGKWNPLGAMGASLFFGFAQSLSIIGAQLPVISSIPPVLLQIAPYLLTIIVLVVFLGKASGQKQTGRTISNQNNLLANKKGGLREVFSSRPFCFKGNKNKKKEGIIMFKRVHLIVMDSVGIGEAPDADKFGDVGSDTLGHIAKEAGLNVPHLEQLGLGTIRPLEGVESVKDHQGYATKLEEVSVGKDTMTGHWEIMGLNIKTPFRVFLMDSLMI